MGIIFNVLGYVCQSTVLVNLHLGNKTCETFETFQDNVKIYALYTTSTYIILVHLQIHNKD